MDGRELRFFDVSLQDTKNRQAIRMQVFACQHNEARRISSVSGIIKRVVSKKK
jgi:hypothetical protein